MKLGKPSNQFVFSAAQLGSPTECNPMGREHPSMPPVAFTHGYGSLHFAKMGLRLQRASHLEWHKRGARDLLLKYLYCMYTIEILASFIPQKILGCLGGPNLSFQLAPIQRKTEAGGGVQPYAKMPVACNNHTRYTCFNVHSLPGHRKYLRSLTDAIHQPESAAQEHPAGRQPVLQSRERCIYTINETIAQSFKPEILQPGGFCKTIGLI